MMIMLGPWAVTPGLAFHAAAENSVCPSILCHMCANAIQIRRRRWRVLPWPLRCDIVHVQQLVSAFLGAESGTLALAILCWQLTRDVEARAIWHGEVVERSNG